MASLTAQQRVEVIKQFYLNKGSIVATIRKLRHFFGQHHVPKRSIIYHVIENFEKRYTLGEVPRVGRPRSVRTTSHIEAVRVSVGESPGTSVRRRAQELNVSKTSLWKMMRKDLLFFPYKIQLVQELKDTDHLRRRVWCERFLQLNNDTPDFWSNLLMSDEAHFDLSGFVNKPRFDGPGLFSVGILEGSGLRQQANNN